MNLTASNTYSLWHLIKNQPIKKLVLNNSMTKIQCINGIVFWLNEDQVLHYCDSEQQPKTLNRFTCNIINFAVCYEHHFMAIYYKDDANKPCLTLLKIELNV
jgi:hypothetical protein